jgi:dihydroorotate dehydrogenase (NAD+) catalytic subunit
MPPDLRVSVGRIELKNPVLCGAGEWTMTEEALRAALDAGAAAVVAKSTNESDAAKRQLGAAEAVVLDEHWRPVANGRAGRSSSLFNRSGLVGERFDRWLETLAAADGYARERDAYVIASLIPADLDELVRMARAVEEAGLRWLELNVGAAHGEEAAAGAIVLASEQEQVADIVAQVRDAITIPLTVKLSGQGDVLAAARAAYEAAADSLCLAGRPLAFLPDPETRRPVLGTFGAIGGAWALPLTLRWIAKARREIDASVPLVATGGVRDGLDVARALLAGASAVQLGTAVWTDGPAALAGVVEGLGRYLDTQGAAACDLIGEAADAVMTYEEAALRRSE